MLPEEQLSSRPQTHSEHLAMLALIGYLNLRQVYDPPEEEVQNLVNSPIYKDWAGDRSLAISLTQGYPPDTPEEFSAIEEFFDLLARMILQFEYFDKEKRRYFGLN